MEGIWGADRDSTWFSATKPVQSDRDQHTLGFQKEECSPGALMLSCLAVLNSLRPRGLWPARLLSLWHFPGKNMGEGGYFLQG